MDDKHVDGYTLSVVTGFLAENWDQFVSWCESNHSEDEAFPQTVYENLGGED